MLLKKKPSHQNKILKTKKKKKSISKFESKKFRRTKTPKSQSQSTEYRKATRNGSIANRRRDTISMSSSRTYSNRKIEQYILMNSKMSNNSGSILSYESSNGIERGFNRESNNLRSHRKDRFLGNNRYCQTMRDRVVTKPHQRHNYTSRLYSRCSKSLLYSKKKSQIRKKLTPIARGTFYMPALNQGGGMILNQSVVSKVLNKSWKKAGPILDSLSQPKQVVHV